jgi:hypothetical protein
MADKLCPECAAKLHLISRNEPFPGFISNELFGEMALHGGCAILRGVRQSKGSYEEILLWIQQRELGDLVASLLEGLEPLTLVGAQIAFLLEPLAGSNLEQIGEILEDPEECRDFIAELREGSEKK